MNGSMRWRSAIAAVVALFAGPQLGCGGASATTTAAAAPRTSARAPAADDAWATMSWEDRHRAMTFLVHPNMARLFQRFQGKRYPDLTCRTCHGADAESVAYTMPRALPPLDPRHLPAPSDGGARGRTAKFMLEEVTPQMADLLGVAPYDAKTGRGFGCFNCHPRSGDEAKAAR